MNAEKERLLWNDAEPFVQLISPDTLPEASLPKATFEIEPDNNT